MILGIVLLSVSTLGITVDAATYYGNGVYCNKQECWVDWNKASKEIGKIIVNGWVATWTLGSLDKRISLKWTSNKNY